MRIGIVFCPICKTVIYRFRPNGEKVIYKKFSGFSGAIQMFPNGLGGFRETSTFSVNLCCDCAEDFQKQVEALLAFVEEPAPKY
jgi:hypothetical protein